MGLWSLESWFESRPRNHFFVGFPVPLPRRGGSHGLLLMTLPFTDRCVLLTGAGGSIGAALAREIIQHGPRSLVLLDHSEGNLHQIDTELSEVPGGAVRSAILGDIADGTLLCEGETMHVCVGDDMKKRSLPPKYAERFAACLI